MTHPQPSFDSSRRPRVWLWLAGLLALGLLILLAAAGIWHLRAGARLEASLTEVAKSGAPVTPEDLEEFYVAPPSDLDATQLWLDGTATLMLPAFANASNGLPFVGGDAKIPPPGLPWSDLVAAEKLLKQHQSSLDLLHQAAALGGAARYPTQFKQGIAMPAPHLGNVRQAARLLALEAHVRAHRNDAQGAAQSIEAMLAVGRSLENDPLFNSLLTRGALDRMARQQLIDLLPHVPFADADLVHLQDRLAQIDYVSGLQRALMGERVMGQQELKNWGAAMILIRGSTRQVHLDFMQRMLDAARLPWPAALRQVKQNQSDLQDASDAASAMGKTAYVVVGLTGEAYEAAFQSVARNRAWNDATIIAIAIERCRRQHDAPPDELSRLVPEYLRTIPFDPFDGRPLKYVPGQEQYLIYNVGADGIDDGGQGDESGKPDDVLRIKFSLPR